MKSTVGTFKVGKAKPGSGLLTAEVVGCPAADPTPGCRPCGGAWLDLGCCCCAGPAPGVVVVGWLL